MTQGIQLNPAMGPQIVRHLRQFADLPTTGILAGQAVDSAITDLFGKGGGVYNDVDVFRKCGWLPVPRKKDFAAKTAFRSKLVMLEAPSNTLADYSSMALTLGTVNTYGIESVSRNGMLNFVNCSMGSDLLAKPLTASLVLSGFDLNCVRVAVDLETGLLSWDQHYEEFLRSRQLKIAMMHTPWHTLIRLAKKKEELPNVFADMALASEACTSVANSKIIHLMRTSRDVSLLFGDKMRKKAEAQHQDLRNYFELEPVQLVKQVQSRYAPGEWAVATDENRFLAQGEEVTLWQMRARGEVNASLQAKVDRLEKGALFFAYKVVEEARRTKSSSVYVKLDALREHRQKQDEKREFVLKHAEMLGTSYVQGQALAAVSDQVNQFLQQHSSFSGLLLGRSLAEQHESISRIQTVVRKFANEFLGGPSQAPYGVLENEATALDLSSEDAIWSLLLKDHKSRTEPFKNEPLPLPTIPAQWAEFEVKELNSPVELAKEGKELSHCVGGYSAAVGSGRARILSIRHKSDRTRWSTAELRVQKKSHSGELVATVVQHRAKRNTAPHELNETLLEYVVAELQKEKKPTPDQAVLELSA